ncbi:MAG TPA: transglutaminase domain-containing protein [Chondromyces sp.]|nr:transglutaminase domain-containing protein [Chondromyces sp.]
MTSPADSSFHDRARWEAARYGADAWVFVRELLQNARDAGASRVWLETARVDGRDRLSCRDDGDGMSFEHAKRYLFTLYASSKRGRSRTAGRFGIGFWSVLRFAPDTLLVRSRPRRGPGWQVRLDAALEVQSVSVAAIERGTEVVLERAADGADISSAVRAAVLRDAPFLGRRDSADRPLEVRVDGEVVRAELELSPPSLGFRRRGLRGVVGLAAAPRVEIFAHGLRVRDAASLEELLVAGGTRRGAGGAIAGALMPSALIDSRELSVLMARGDAREDRALRRLVAVGNRELARLVRAELDRHTRSGFVRRAVEAVREAWASARWLRLAAASAALIVLAVLGWGRLGPGSDGGEPAAQSPPVATVSAAPTVAPYRGLAGRYMGPEVDSVAGSRAAIELRFRPRGARPHFAVLTVSGLDEFGRPVGSAVGRLRPYAGAPCLERCLELELEVVAERGSLRLPLATGHAIDPQSVRLDGAVMELLADDGGRPVLRFETATEGVLSYRSGPVFEGASGAVGDWPPLPSGMLDWVSGATGQAPSALASAAADVVARQVRYDASPSVIEAHRAARARGLDLFERAALVGAGDCDVQNALLTALLGAAGVPARLAVGWLGADGRALPGLHAWVEFEAEDGGWRVVDASVLSLAAATPSEQAVQRSGRWPRWPAARTFTFSLILLAVAVAVALLLRRSWRRELQPGTAGDIAGLLRGAAARPASYAGAEALFARRVVPLLGGRRVSLARARSASRDGRLAAGSAGSDLARRAASAGGLVIDAASVEGAAVVGALGAVDLDGWQELLSRSRPTAVASRVERALAEAGEPCRVRVAAAVGEEIAVLFGPQLALPGSETWLVVDEEAEIWRMVSGVADARPAHAALLLADAVTEHLGMPVGRRRRCLAALASSALSEAAGGAV